MLDAKNVLTIGVSYHPVLGGVAAVESVYSTFYKPFNHIATVVDCGTARKLIVFIKAYLQFWWHMLRHKEIKIVHVHGSTDSTFGESVFLSILPRRLARKLFFIAMVPIFTYSHQNTLRP